MRYTAICSLMFRYFWSSLSGHPSGSDNSSYTGISSEPTAFPEILRGGITIDEDKGAAKLLGIPTPRFCISCFQALMQLYSFLYQ